MARWYDCISIGREKSRPRAEGTLCANSTPEHKLAVCTSHVIRQETAGARAISIRSVLDILSKQRSPPTSPRHKHIKMVNREHTRVTESVNNDTSILGHHLAVTFLPFPQIRKWNSSQNAVTPHGSRVKPAYASPLPPHSVQTRQKDPTHRTRKKTILSRRS